MIMLSRTQLEERGYSEAYIDARMKVENLCRQIGTSALNNDEAIELYDAIENEYVNRESEGAELFRRIYRSRIVRLCGEFVGNKC
jgi:hypothetical protein